MNFEHLKAMEPLELKQLAGKMGLSVHHKAGKERIIKQIMEKSLLSQINPAQPDEVFKGEDMRPKAVKNNAKPEYDYTEADVREACKVFLEKDGFQAQFPGDGTWIFTYKGAQDSGTLKQPMSRIKMKASNVAKGRLALMAHPNQFFEPTAAGGNSAYTNVVLA